jgi:hypothetical protein
MPDSGKVIGITPSSEQLCCELGALSEKFHQIRKTFNGPILSKIECKEAYKGLLKRILGGIRSEEASPPHDEQESNHEKVIELLLQFYRGVTDGHEPLWMVIQHYSLFHEDQLWAARSIAPQFEAEFGSYLTYLNSWYYEMARKADGTGMAGFYNLFLNPEFLRPEYGLNAGWMPRSVLICRDSVPNNTMFKDRGDVLRLDDLSGEIESKMAPVRELLMAKSKEASSGEDAQNEFAVEIGNLLNQITKELEGSKVVDDLRSELARAVARNTVSAKDNFDYACTQVRRVLCKKVPDRQLIGTMLFLLLHVNEWRYYYYFVLQGAPDRSSTALVVATDVPLAESLEVCLQQVVNLTAGGLALVEARAIEERETRGRAAYSLHLQSHSFTKGFTTPLANEVLCLKRMANDDASQHYLSQLDMHVGRLEAVMQSGERVNYWQVSPPPAASTTEEYTQTRELDPIDCSDLLGCLKDYAYQRIEFRFNDLYDDSRFECYGPGDLARPLERWEELVDVDGPIDCSDGCEAPVIYAHRALLFYHLQCLIDNAVEALDLAAAAAEKGPKQRLRIWYNPRPEEGVVEIGISNDGLGKLGSDQCVRIQQWQDQLADPCTKRASWPDVGRKSGAHSGRGLLLTAAYCKSLRGTDSGRCGTLSFPDTPRIGPDVHPGETPRKYAANVVLTLPLGTVQFDAGILRKIPRPEPPRPEKQGSTAPPSQDVKTPLVNNLRSLIVEDDTADRRRFRLLLEQCPGYVPMAFAWDATTQMIWPADTIISTLKKNPECVLLLDLAWSRYDEACCDELRGARTPKEFKSMLDNANCKPSGLALLDQITSRGVANPVIVVTAYRFTWMEEYCYTYESVRGIFMKWSDEEDLLACLLRSRRR